MKKDKVNNQKTMVQMKPSCCLSSDICSKCKKNKATHNHHTIFDPVTNKSDKNSPIIDICATCHAKIHKTEPNLSELRVLIQRFQRLQRLRIQVENSERGYNYLELKTPEEYNQILDIIKNSEKKYEKEIKYMLEGKDHVVPGNQASCVFPLYHNFLKKVKGIGHLLSGQLIANMDLSKFNKVSSVWKYCGMHVIDGKAPRRKKGSKINWNPSMRMLCYKISDSFIKQRTQKYRDIYDREKEKQLKLIGEDISTSFMEPTKKLTPPLSKGHVDNRARRKAVKEFLKDIFIAYKKIGA